MKEEDATRNEGEIATGLSRRREPAANLGDVTSSSEESGSDESSGTETDSSAEVMIKPIFVSKSQRKVKEKEKEADIDHSAKLDKFNVVEKAPKDEYDDIDDTDDIDPEEEYKAWTQREVERFIRDREIIKQQDLEFQEALKRSEDI